MNVEQVDLQSEPISIHYDKMIAVNELLDARDHCLAQAISLARRLADELERYDAMGAAIGDYWAVAIETESRAAGGSEFITAAAPRSS